MYLNVSFLTREEQIPKGCRKPRFVDVTRNHTIQIREVSEDVAPVALVETPTPAGLQTPEDDQSSSETPSTLPKVYRWYDRRLWIPMSPEQEDEFTTALHDPATVGRQYAYYGRDASGVILNLDDWARTRLIIDGVPYIETGEPYYHIDLTETFRFSWITLTVDHAPPLRNTPTADKFPITQADQALARARAIHAVLVEQDNRHVPSPELPAVFQVRLPEAVQHCFVPSARTPTRVQVEMQCTIQAAQAWAVDSSDDTPDGFRLLDGRRVIPLVALALLDETTGQLTPLSTDDAAALGFVTAPGEYRAYRQREIRD